MASLELRGLTKSFGPLTVLHGVDLTLADGEMVVIVGASGCGKSTLLRLVAGLEQPSAGAVVLDGRDITQLDPAARDIAMVFQNYALYPHMSVFENMAYGLRIRRLPKAEIRNRVDHAAALLGIEGLLDRKPRALSGGQRQRVAMGRAIVREPKLFLFDEPLSNLDAKLRVQMRAEIRRLQRRLGVTSLYVTHDQVEAMTLGDRLVVMHEGRPVQVARPTEVFSRPADTYVAGFIGAPSMNFLPARLAQAGRAAALEVGPVIEFADAPRPGPEGRLLIIGIRPEHVTLLPAAEAARGLSLAVDLVEPLGSETLLHGRLPGGAALTVQLPGMVPVGDAVAVALPAASLHVFDAESGRRLDPAPATPPAWADAGEVAVRPE
ncbi:MAG: sn-glycerol-3-phosphate ABC transporter ATP-binding protein UgpC [Rhodospirillales bacterium]|nr:sn-glycerol-3-phosphate ABC transporter ATP-binding protein UgpC [Rhodospirillales bacterium]